MCVCVCVCVMNSFKNIIRYYEIFFTGDTCDYHENTYNKLWEIKLRWELNIKHKIVMMKKGITQDKSIRQYVI